MEEITVQKIFDNLEISKRYPDDPDLRVGDCGYIVERHSYGADHSFGWKVAESGDVISNFFGTYPRIG